MPCVNTAIIHFSRWPLSSRYLVCITQPQTPHVPPCGDQGWWCLDVLSPSSSSQSSNHHSLASVIPQPQTLSVSSLGVWWLLDAGRGPLIGHQLTILASDWSIDGGEGQQLTRHNRNYTTSCQLSTGNNNIIQGLQLNEADTTYLILDLTYSG